MQADEDVGPAVVGDLGALLARIRAGVVLAHHDDRDSLVAQLVAQQQCHGKRDVGFLDARHDALGTTRLDVLHLAGTRADGGKGEVVAAAMACVDAHGAAHEPLPRHSAGLHVAARLRHGVHETARRLVGRTRKLTGGAGVARRARRDAHPRRQHGRKGAAAYDERPAAYGQSGLDDVAVMLGRRLALCPRVIGDIGPLGLFFVCQTLPPHIGAHGAWRAGRPDMQPSTLHGAAPRCTPRCPGNRYSAANVHHSGRTLKTCQTLCRNFAHI